MNPNPQNLSEFKFAGPRVRIFCELWEEISSWSKLEQVDRWLSQRLKREKRFGGQDRRWYSDAVFNAFRFGVTAVALEEAFRAGGLSDSLWLSWKERTPGSFWRLLQKIPAQRLTSLLSGLLSGNFVSEKEQQIWLALLKEQTPEALLLQNGIAPWLAPYCLKRQRESAWDQEDFAAWIKGQNNRAPLWLRLNDPQYSASCQKELTNAMSLSVHSDGPLALAVTGAKGIYNAASFIAGQFEIQDRASQFIGEAVEISQNGTFIWDACAGGGGKSLQLAARMMGRGAIYASDVRGYKLEELKRRAKRAKFSNIHYLDWDGQELTQLPKAVTKRGGFDAILIDAPCSSSGTWRRNPDARFRIDETLIEEISAIQRDIIRFVLPHLRTGGQLVYATCSWLYEENEAIIREWLIKWPSLTLERMEMLGFPRFDSDTMFVATMRKSATS